MTALASASRRVPPPGVIAERLESAVGSEIAECFASYLRNQTERVEFLFPAGEDKDARRSMLRVKIVAELSSSAAAMTDIIVPAAWRILEMEGSVSSPKYQSCQIVCYAAVEEASAGWWRDYLGNGGEPGSAAVFNEAGRRVISKAVNKLHRWAHQT